MFIDEINWYQTLLVKVSNSDVKRYICPVCGQLLKKFGKFHQQCQDASWIMEQALTQESRSMHLTYSHNYIVNSKTFYIGPEKTIDNFDSIIEHNEFENECVIGNNKVIGNDDVIDIDDVIEDSDGKDDLPLVMLEGRKKKKKKDEVVGTVSTIIDNDSVHSSKSKRGRGKTLREGFTSRMVQETDEYIVIKLTKEQVLAEMKEKAECDKYKRALYKCEKCVKGYNFEDVLQSHMEKHNKESGEFECDICTQHCPSRVSLRGHLKSHTTRYKCKICGDIRLSRQHLLEHYAITHTASATEYTCDQCYFTTNKRTVIQRHVKKSHKPSERHACHECGRLFQNIESLRVHTTRHDKSKRLQCSHCPRKFIYPSLLHKHVVSVHESRDCYCVECDVRFTSRENMRLHFKKAKKHRDASSYTHQCPQCQDRFLSPSSLEVHLSVAHGAPRKPAERERQKNTHDCTLCDKVFTRKSILTVHMRSHTGERPYLCECGAAFAQATSLKTHKAAKHPECSGT